MIVPRGHSADNSNLNINDEAQLRLSGIDLTSCSCGGYTYAINISSKLSSNTPYTQGFGVHLRCLD